jgi:hypothetical protein
MSIRYVCFFCREELKISGNTVVNECGRKYCDKCGTNYDNLECVSEKEYNEALRRLNGKV